MKIDAESLNKIIGGVTDIASLFADGSKYDVFRPTSEAGRMDIDEIRSQEIETKPFAIGDIGSGLAAGASIGSATVPGIGTLIGAAAGAVAGTSSALLKEAKKNRAKLDFDIKKRAQLQAAHMRNAGLDVSDYFMRNIGAQSRATYENFYSSIFNR